MKRSVVLSIGFIGFVSGILGILPNSIHAQTVEPCGISAATTKLYAEHPELLPLIQQAASELEAQAQLKTNAQNEQLLACSDVMVVPIVFHIVHQNGAENISDQTVFDAMNVLNEDFRLWNSDTAAVTQAFQPVLGKAMIEFRLAQIDPFGNPTTGIDRIVSTETNVGDDGSKLNPWPRSKYLNIWVVRTIPNAAAYAYLPSSVAPGFNSLIDGIITRYTVVGKGERTLTHEVGHWINLMHVWGPGNNAGEATNCSQDDNVGDTPNCLGTLGGCDTTRNTCSSIDLVQNYMDYALCEIMFTAGQVSRMRASLSSPTAQRSSLITDANLIATGVYGGGIAFSTGLTQVCAGEQVVFQDQSFNGICQWNWSFPGGTPSTSSKRAPVVSYGSPGTYDVMLTVANDTGSLTMTKADYITVVGTEQLPYFETFTGSSDWLVNGSGGPSWEYASFTYDGSPGTMVLYNFGQGSQGEKDELISPPIDLTTLSSGKINFKLAYAQVDATTNDMLRIYISGDCGNSWTQAWSGTGPVLSTPNGQITTNFVPNSTSNWKSFNVNLSPLMLTGNFRFKFEFTSDEGNNIFIDNINLTGTTNSTPILVSPPNFTEGEGMVVTMDWNAIDNVDFYDVRVDTVYTMDSPFLINNTYVYIDSSDDGTDTEYTVGGLDSGQAVYWSVRTREGTSTSGWSATWKFTTAGPIIVGVDDIDASISSLLVFPNPSSGNITIDFNLHSNYSEITLDIFDVLGRTVDIQAQTFNQLSAGHHEIDVDVAQSGVYYVRLNVDEKSYYSRFSIAK